MTKLIGYKNVAVVVQGCYNKKYYYAIYDDGFDYNVGTKVLVSGDREIKTIDSILTLEEANNEYKGTITAEVICPVNTMWYDERCDKRKQAEKIKKEMDKKIKQMQENNKYALYAEKSSELAELLASYKELIG